MSVTTAAVNEEVKILKGDAYDLAIGLTEVKTEVKNAIGLARWAGTVLVTTLLTSGIGAVIWGASLTVKVYGMETRSSEKFQELGTRVDKLEASIDRRFDKMDARLEKMDARFDRLESLMSKLIEQTKPQSSTSRPPMP